MEQLVIEDPHAPEVPDALFLTGWCLEEADVEAALRAYGEVIADHGGTPAARDARFRRGLTLARLQRHREALVDLRRLEGMDAAQGEPAAAILQLQIGASELALGRRRRAVDRIAGALTVLQAIDEVLDPDIVWYRCQAHVLLGDATAHGVDLVSMKTTSDRSQRKRLARRLTLQRLAADHYRAAAHADAPLWTCAAGFKLGQLYERQYAALSATPAPRQLDPAQQQLYRQGLAVSTLQFWHLARDTYTDTVDFARRAGISNEWTEAAQRRLDEMDLAPVLQVQGV
jgi:tetratricopeptide (TPR) repeat protein